MRTAGRALAQGLMEQVVARDNLNRAFKKVAANKGAPGLDGMTIDQLREWASASKEALSTACSNGTLNSNPSETVGCGEHDRWCERGEPQGPPYSIIAMAPCIVLRMRLLPCGARLDRVRPLTARRGGALGSLQGARWPSVPFVGDSGPNC